MQWLDRFKLRLRTLFRRKQVERELHREMEFHLQEQIKSGAFTRRPLPQEESADLVRTRSDTLIGLCGNVLWRKKVFHTQVHWWRGRRG